MDSDRQIRDNEDLKSAEQQNPLAIVPSKEITSPPFATASISRSLSTILPSHFFAQPKTSALFSPQPNKVKVPTQAASLAHLSISTSSPSLSKISFKSTISAIPLHSPFALGPHRPLDPSNGAAIRRASIVWFRNDLRVRDNECLNSANNESMSVLPVYCFDPGNHDKSSPGFDKSGSYQAAFVIEAVSDLRKNLQARGSDLVVRIGKPETILVELAKAIGADAVYAHREASRDEVKAEERVEAAMKEENIEVKYFWGSTLYHLDDLPFKLEDMPSNYGGFKEKAGNLEIRKTIEALDQLKGLPSRGDVEPGQIPSLTDLGLNPSATMDGKQAASTCMVGGETEALQRLRKIAAECKAQPHKGFKNGTQDSIYGANFSCKISPWLSTGCVSPRTIFDELKKTASRTFSASSNQNDGGSGSNWLMHEFLWRDFFRFTSKKYSTAKKHLETAPALA
ncbi:blue-light photoreceptor PHR2-like isoform X2 [Prosopis cineraria]|uniref:blue-light photoreceptor PHR2-like isoform X2 n=1 Tax=Prosopis cineraria TaxID=364024 RepID=UPI00240FCC2F|nr:blue-light photoreceptor PHR2-like isoform X2 [Prosopis cineraria]